MTCRLPVECAKRFKMNGIALNELTIAALSNFCASNISPRFAAAKFEPGIAVRLNDGACAKRMEKSLATWALSTPIDWSWLSLETGLVNILAMWRTSVQGADIKYSPTLRPAQLELAGCAAKLIDGNIGVVEASTGIGKTLVFSLLAKALAAKERIVIAVPTLAIGRQWQSVWASLGCAPLDEVWGKSRYGVGDEGADQQAQAIERSVQSRAVLCSHHMVGVLAARVPIANLFVDEAHLLERALASMAGAFYPIEIFGTRLLEWYSQAVDGVALGGDVLLSGKRRADVLARIKLGPLDAAVPAEDWQVSIVGSDVGTPLVWLHKGGTDGTEMAGFWRDVGRAWLFSGTLSERTPAGLRSVASTMRRLGVPPDRRQDLGQVRVPWRDSGVVVMTPESAEGTDLRLWLSAHRDRKDLWREEVAAFLRAQCGVERKMLLLMNSYADILALQLLMQNLPGVVYSTRDTSFIDSRSSMELTVNWLWVATGAAWAGLDIQGLTHLAIGSLPLPDPTKFEGNESLRQAASDSVRKFKQGVGRLVRSDETGLARSLKISILDGRLNERSRAWRKICQPIRQVLGDEFEVHGYMRHPSTFTDEVIR